MPASAGVRLSPAQMTTNAAPIRRWIMSKTPVECRLLVDHDSCVVTTKAAQPSQRSVGIAQFVKWSQSQAVQLLAVLRDRGDLDSRSQPGLEAHRVGIGTERSRLNVEMRFSRDGYGGHDARRLGSRGDVGQTHGRRR